jgi:predicted AAA+ superfamily ATPase
MNDKIKTIYDALSVVSVFTDTVERPLVKTFFSFVEGTTIEEKRKAYGKFVAKIYEVGGDLTDAVRTLLAEDENVYVKAMANGKSIPAHIENATKRELVVFSSFAALTKADFEKTLNGTDLPDFDSEKADFQKEYKERLESIGQYGYGVFASYGMFRFSDEKKIEPIVSADKIRLNHFIGYETERKKVYDNTLAFTQNRPAANVLLYGDAGAGKSSTVKAIANEFFDKGVRLIELRKDQLCHLPLVMEKISHNPLKFILFIDDLSFQQSDDNFSMLKAALEGSASARTKNCIIYATSNRRHIVKESFSDREGGDVHRNDTLQETLSLSERFGLTVLFGKPDKKLYLQIVKELAERNGLYYTEQMGIEAEAFALKKGNRSARGAEQFIDSLL